MATVDKLMRPTRSNTEQLQINEDYSLKKIPAVRSSSLVTNQALLEKKLCIIDELPTSQMSTDISLSKKNGKSIGFTHPFSRIIRDKDGKFV